MHRASMESALLVSALLVSALLVSALLVSALLVSALHGLVVRPTALRAMWHRIAARRANTCPSEWGYKPTSLKQHRNIDGRGLMATHCNNSLTSWHSRYNRI